MKTVSAPLIELHSGIRIPAIGLGVFQTPPEETAQAVEAALATGYRHIDTAAAYGNEREVAEGIRRSGIDRGEIFIETKVWISDYGYDAALHAFDKSATKLGADEIDLLILHQALSTRFDLTVRGISGVGGAACRRQGPCHWRQQLHADHLDSLLAQTEVVPAVNQIELHPYFSQPRVQEANAQRGILTQALSPIGGITSYRGDPSRSTFTDPVIGRIAEAHGKTAAQVMLRWHVQQGRSAIPKSVRPERIAENFDVFGFELTTDELAAIDALDTGVRGGPEPADVTLEAYGRPIPEA